ncbi:MAG: LysR family transcriptional regulator [Rhodospirillales bacterium]|nr:LysR family transcriptional regulator [Rhodospirillales bacterium]
MTISVAHLRAFHGVALEGGFSKAARAMSISQSTLSLHVSALEEGYGVQLFERRGRKVTLTKFGLDLLPITGKLFENLEQVEELLTGAMDLKSGYLSLGATGPHQIIPYMTAFKQLYPGPRLSLHLNNGEAILASLKERHIDVAVHSAPPRGQGLGVIPLSIDLVVLCVAPDHHLAGKKSVKLNELIDETLIVREKETYTRALIDGAFEKAGLHPDDILETDNWESVRELVIAGLGVSLMSAADAGPGDRIVRVPLKEPALEITEYLIFDSERRRLKIVRAFLDLVEKLTGEPWYKL